MQIYTKLKDNRKKKTFYSLIISNVSTSPQNEKNSLIFASVADKEMLVTKMALTGPFLLLSYSPLKKSILQHKE